jgi:uroporphyrinogen decarboxylase
MGLCKSPDLATEVTLQPLARFPLDAAILFSDILTIPDAMGLGLYFSTGEGPKFERPLRQERDIRALGVPDPNIELGYVMAAVRQIRQALDNSVPLIGFSGSPFTLACYMVEGGGSADFSLVKTMLYERPDLLHHILDVNARAVTAYLNAQIEAGAQALMIFDSWGGALSEAAYAEFSLAYMQQIMDGLIRESDLDPVVLFSNPDTIRAEVGKVLHSYGPGSGHVFNLGHGISQFTQPENAAAMVAAVHELSRPNHA